MEGLDGDFIFAIVFVFVILTVKLEVVFDGAAWVCGFLVYARGDSAGDGPEDHEDGDGGEDGDEEGRP